MATDKSGRRHPPPAVLLQRIARRTAAARQGQGHPGSTAACDAALIRSCRRVAHVEARKLGLFAGPLSIPDDARRDAELARLDRTQHPDLDHLACSVPATWHGHRLRAATFHLVDAGGLYAQARSGLALDRLLLAIILDLAAP